MREEEEGECGGCGKLERWPFIHNVRHRVAYRKMCTNCILSTHPDHFCPFCFRIHEHRSSIPNPSLLSCMKCSSVSHSACVPIPHSPNFLCPSCSTSAFLYFNPIPAPTAPLSHRLDKNSARALVAAAQIAAESMSKAASLARLEAERRVKEAVFAKKRARDALETLGSLYPSSNRNFQLAAPHVDVQKRPRYDSSSASHFGNGDADGVIN